MAPSLTTTLKSETGSVTIGHGLPFVIIGEKINPTGNKKLAAALIAEDFDFVARIASRQAAAGANILDVNVGVPELDEVKLLPKVVAQVSKVTGLPLCLDSASPAALAAGLAVAPGKPLVNSVNGEERLLQSILPIVKDRGAAVIGLTMDDSGIPDQAEKRLEIAEKILERALQNGIPVEDVIIDPLAMAVATDSRAGLVTLTAVRMIHEKLGVNVSLGASNVSHGLPERPVINQAFLALAIAYGATCSITDPLKMGLLIRAVDLLLARDEYGMGYIRAFRKIQALTAAEAQK